MHSRAWASRLHTGNSRVHCSPSAPPPSGRTHPVRREKQLGPTTPSGKRQPPILSSICFLPSTQLTVCPNLILMYRLMAALSCLSIRSPHPPHSNTSAPFRSLLLCHPHLEQNVDELYGSSSTTPPPPPPNFSSSMRAIERQSLLAMRRFHTRERVNIPCLDSSSKPTAPETDVITRATSTWCFLARFLSLLEYLASILLAFLEREAFL